MKTLDRYLAGFFLRNLALAVIGLTLFMFLQALMLDIFSRDFTSAQVLIYHALNIPSVMVQLAPPATLLAIVFTLSGLSRTHELIACFSIGIGLQRIVQLLMSIVFIEACFVLVLEDRVLPPLYKARTNYYWHEMKKRPDFFLDIKQDKIWYRSQNLIYNLQRFDSLTNQIVGMAVYTFDESFQLKQIMQAEKAEYSKQGWKLKDGVVTSFDRDPLFPQTTTFRSKALTIGETPQDFRELDREVDGLRFKELNRYIKKAEAAGADTKGYEVKFYSRLALGFMPLVMAMLGVPFATRSRREGGAARDLSFCMALTFVYWMLYSVGLSLGKTGALPTTVAAFGPSLIFLALAIALQARKT